MHRDLELGRRRHGAMRVGLGLALEPVGGVGDLEPAAVIRPGDGTLTLLDHMGELMGQGVPVRAAVADDDVAAGGEGAGTDLGRRRLRRAAVVDAHIGEVRAEPALHVGAGGLVQGVTRCSQDTLHGRALHRGLPIVLVPASGGVPVLLLGPGVSGLTEHLHHCGIARTPLQGHRARGGRRHPFRSGSAGGRTLLLVRLLLRVVVGMPGRHRVTFRGPGQPPRIADRQLPRPKPPEDRSSGMFQRAGGGSNRQGTPGSTGSDGARRDIESAPVTSRSQLRSGRAGPTVGRWVIRRQPAR